MNNKKVTNGRKNTPDIMGNLMGTAVVDKEHKNNKAIKQESNTAIKKESNKMVQTSIAMPKKPENNKTIIAAKNKDIQPVSNKEIIEPAKERSTFNLSLDTLSALDDAWMQLRRKFKGEQRITKTLIVELALKIALGDLESKNELSDLFMQLKD